MKSIVLWLYRRARLIQLRHDLALWKLTMREEEERHAAFDERMRRMRVECAHLQGEIDRLSGRARIDYSFGPTMKGTRQ